MNNLLSMAAALLLAAPVAAMAQVPPACPATPMRVVRSGGGVTEYIGHVGGVPELCHERRPDGEGDFYLGIWRSDWPGAGEAYPLLRAVIQGKQGMRAGFVNREWPGMQFNDSFVNEGIETVDVGGTPHRTLRIAHERAGFDNNTYHSIITSWLDLATGATLKVHENQIAGQSYGPATTWQAIALERLP